MTLEKAYGIKKLCDKIDDIDKTIQEIESCAYIELNVLSSDINTPKTIKVYKEDDMYKNILYTFKTKRDNIIKEINNIDEN